MDSPAIRRNSFIEVQQWDEMSGCWYTFDEATSQETAFAMIAEFRAQEEGYGIENTYRIHKVENVTIGPYADSLD